MIRTSALALVVLFGCSDTSLSSRDASLPDGGRGTDGGDPPDATSSSDAGQPTDAFVPEADGFVIVEPDPEPGPAHERAQSKSATLLFDPARDRGETIGYHSFRIPALARVGDTLIAFAEARQCGHDDFGNINMVYKRSTDEGRTWGPLEEVVGRGPGTWGNPTPVVDHTTGTVFLFMSFNEGDISQYGRVNPCTGETTAVVGPGDRPVFMSRSDDEGGTWTDPVDLTATLQRPGTSWDAMGPGIGIQTTIDHPGRLIVPAARRNIYSDDHGETWHYQMLPSGTSEGTIVELYDGSLLRNDRAVGRVWETGKRRWLSRGVIDASEDSDTILFEDFAPHDTLLDPRVQGSSLRYTVRPHRLLFLNPSSTVSRCRMRVRMSYDGGETWPVERRLHDDLSSDETCDLLRGGYSSMVKTADHHVAVLVERGGENRSIELHRFNLPWLVDGTPEPLP